MGKADEAANGVVAVKEPQEQKCVPDFLAVSAKVGSVDMWDLDTEERPAKPIKAWNLDGNHVGPILVLIAYIDRIFSGGADGTVCVWTSKGWACVARLVGFAGAVLALAVANDEYLYAGYRDGTLRRWKLQELEDKEEDM